MITAKDLMPFVSQDETRPAICQLFDVDDRTVATDGRIMISVPKLEHDKETESEHLNTCRSSVRALFKDSSEYGEFKPLLKDDGTWFESCEDCDGLGKTERIQCPNCGYHIGVAHPVECPSCDGKGKRQSDSRKAVKFGIHLLKPLYIDLLAGLPNVMLAAHKTDPMAPVAIKFDDGGEGRLMPMRM